MGRGAWRAPVHGVTNLATKPTSVYLTGSGLICGMQDPCCDIQDIQLQSTDPLVAALGS